MKKPYINDPDKLWTPVSFAVAMSKYADYLETENRRLVGVHAHYGEVRHETISKLEKGIPFECPDCSSLLSYSTRDRIRADKLEAENEKKDRVIARLKRGEYLDQRGGGRQVNTCEIIKKYLIENKFDGLFNSEGECFCWINEIFPDETCIGQECKAAHMIKCDLKCGASFPCFSFGEQCKCTPELLENRE